MTLTPPRRRLAAFSSSPIVTAMNSSSALPCSHLDDASR